MEKKDFWLLTLCGLIITTAFTGLTRPLRIAYAVTGIALLVDVIKQAKKLYHGREQSED